jgi:L-threonylcarbamoyladenylate synthase
MRSHKMTLASHEATQLEQDDITDETLVLTFSENQKWKIISEYDYVKHVYTFNEFVEDDREVRSAHGQPLVVYGENFELLRELVKKLATKLNEEAK